MGEEDLKQVFARKRFWEVYEIFMVLYSIYDIVSDCLWLLEDVQGKYLEQNPESKTAKRVCTFAWVALIFNAVRFLLETFGKLLLRNAHEEEKSYRAMVYTARQIGHRKTRARPRQSSCFWVVRIASRAS